MLTKDLLRHKRRASKIVPTFVDPTDADLLGHARVLIEMFEDAPGLETGELEERLEGLDLGSAEIKAGLEKLLFDRCEMVEDDGTAEELRWEVFEAAERARAEHAYESKAEFDAALALGADRDLEDLRLKLYADLPAHRKILAFKDMKPEGLLHRYNVAQVQGLLLRATRVAVIATGVTLPERRRLLRLLKFNRLLTSVDVDGGAGDLRLELSGPMSLFDQAQVYGMRIATFFPHVLHLARWRLEAEVKMHDKVYELELDQKSGLKSHYERRDSYVPPELTAALAAFNAAHPGAGADAGEDFVHIGRQSYCFPDITITRVDSGQKVHFELFHRWHAGQLKGRLAALGELPRADLRIGICRSLEKDEGVKAAIASSAWFAAHGFVFREFPTPKALWEALQRG